MTLFRELIQVSIGNRVCLSRTPSAAEWGELYAMAKKQSLVGVCFAGVQKLQLQQQCPEEMLYLTWMGMAAKIQQRNEVVNRQCAELQAKLSADGFRSCILKGQGVAQVYPESLRGLRQSGDIDIWIEGDKDAALDWARKQGASIGSIDMVHAHADLFSDTEVEIHSQPSWMYGRKADKVLQRFFAESASEQFGHHDEKTSMTYPTVGFNLVYSLVHINRHIFEEGIGLRQLLDYYFILKASNVAEREKVHEEIAALGLKKFAAGIMYIESKVFAFGRDCMVCEPDAVEGEFLLEDIERGGNFGKYDERNVVLPVEKRFARGWYNMLHNVRYLWHYPSEVLAIPFWKVWHYCWRKRKGYL